MSQNACITCEYFSENGDQENISESEPRTRCQRCHVQFCTDHLNETFSKDMFEAILEIGSNPPSIMGKCSQCSAGFCKYGIFGDPEQGIQQHYYGPHGQTDLIQACLIENNDVFELEPLVCEIGNCVGNHVIFCSLDCKDIHSPKCHSCEERIHSPIVKNSETFCKECAEYE